MRPRWLALLALALVLASGFAWLGDWQLQRSRDEAAREVAQDAEDAPVTALDDVLAPATAVTGDVVGRRVEATGVLGASLPTTARDLEGEPGAWLVAPLLVDGDGTLPVVLGWLPEGEQPPAVPAGTVTLTGRLEQSEAPTGAAPGDTLEAVSSADLVNVWEPPLYTAYLVVADPPAPLREVPPAGAPSGFALQNLSYALQWWLFAAFAVFFWWRVVRDAHARDQEPVPTPADAGRPGEDGDRVPLPARGVAHPVPRHGVGDGRVPAPADARDAAEVRAPGERQERARPR